MTSVRKMLKSDILDELSSSYDITLGAKRAKSLSKVYLQKVLTQLRRGDTLSKDDLKKLGNYTSDEYSDDDELDSQSADETSSSESEDEVYIQNEPVKPIKKRHKKSSRRTQLLKAIKLAWVEQGYDFRQYTDDELLEFYPDN